MTEGQPSGGAETTEDLIRLLGPGAVAEGDRRLHITAMLVRNPATGRAGIGGELGAKDQVGAFVDAIHWLTHGGCKPPSLEIVLGRGEHMAEVGGAVSTLMAALAPGIRDHVVVLCGGKALPHSPGLADASADAEWLRLLDLRQEERLPKLAQALSARVGCKSFRWYKTVTGRSWSGRVEGLQVCQVKARDTRAVLRVGREGRGGGVSEARKLFLHLAGGRTEVEFSETDMDAAVKTVIGLAGDRQGASPRSRELEHRLEARILRGAVPLAIDGHDLQLVVAPDEPPFQFPARWSLGGKAKYIDCLAREGQTPWVIEIKQCERPGKGLARYYRQGVAQAVLYREFLQGASRLHPWFQVRGLKPELCEAAVAFPHVHGTAGADYLEHCTAMAEAFRRPVQLIELGNT